MEASPSCEDPTALYAGVHKKPPLGASQTDADSSLSSLAQEQLSLDGDSDSLATSQSSSSLDHWGGPGAGRKLVKTYSGPGNAAAGARPGTDRPHPHGLIRPHRKHSEGGVSELDASPSAEGDLEQQSAGVSRSATEGEMKRALGGLSAHGVSSSSPHGLYGLTRPRRASPRRQHLIATGNGGISKPVSTWQQCRPDPNYAYSTKHLLYHQQQQQRSRTLPSPFASPSRSQSHSPSPPSRASTSPRPRHQHVASSSTSGRGELRVGPLGWRLRGRSAVSELNITYVVERSLHGHLSWTQLVRPVALSNAERRCLLLEEDENYSSCGGSGGNPSSAVVATADRKLLDADRKWVASVDRCTRRVLLRFQQKSVSLVVCAVESRVCRVSPTWPHRTASCNRHRRRRPLGGRRGGVGTDAALRNS